MGQPVNAGEKSQVTGAKSSQKENAEIKPERQTVTVGWGDDVTLTMMTSLNEASLKWRYNGTEKPEWKGHYSIQVLHAKSSDAGIYECYIDDSQRKEGKHGFMRLIVRDCPSGKWEPPNCLKTCPTCYNGGVCKSETGKCICPPGFKGQQCENACGKNKWGIECGQRCSSRIMDACRKTMYCISDPYGCSCSASYGGLDCATDCPAGKYGSGCTQLCHCTTKCDKATGKCDGGSCMEGWTGTNCNIPTACPTGFYGEVCNYNCHCENKGPCDKTSGVCSNNKCAAGWINTDIPDCQQDGTKTLIQSLKYVKVNPGEETWITCEVFGNPFSWSDELTLRDLSEPDTSIPSTATRMSGKYTYFANFSINTEDERRYSLSLKSGSSKQITVTQYVLPRFSSNNLPNVSVDASTATVRWQRWSATDDLGDGPIQAYMVYYKRSADADWILHENVDAGDSSTSTYSSVITGLDWSTRYDVTVTLKRPGPKGEGSKESFVTVTTLCDEPTEEPVILNVTSPDPHTLKIDIEIPDPSTIRCHDKGYINHMSVKYKKSDTLSDYEQTIVSGHSFGNDVVEGLVDGLLAYTEYDVLVSFYNFHKQSPWSSVYKARTAEDVPSQPRNVTAEATVTALKVNWLIPDPTNGVIDKYEIRYWKTGDPVYKKVGIMMEDLRITNSFLITNLTYKSNYTIQIQASTTAGLGPPSQALVIQTTDILPGPPGSLEVQEINDNSITITWTEPITFAGDIQNYGVSYHSIESVFKTFANTSMSFTLDGNNHVYTLENLAAGTRYEIKVNASTAKGFGDKKTIVSGTTLSVNLSTILPVTAEMMNYTERTRNTATIKLPQLAKDTTLSQDTKFIDYIVVVDRGENAAIPKKTFNAKMLYHNETVNASYYVAASFALAKIPSTFVLGDNGLYGGFNNSPLDFGIQYYIYYGLRSNITGSYVFYMPENPLLSIKDCAIGKYGPICNKTCHCAVGCNIETGKCNMGLCEQEWSGSKCHIPDFCEAGYYGELCDQNCHCSRNSECDRNTSVCSNGQCAPGWIDVDTDGCQQDGSKKIRSLHSLKVNPGEETYIVCEATANPVIEPKDLILLDLSVHSHVNLTDWYISKKYVFVANFSITVYSHTLYALAIAGGPSHGIAVDLYDLPRFSPSNLPNVSVDASTATVRWQRWSATNDLGDGPIQAYIVYYKLSTDVHWIYMKISMSQIHQQVHTVRHHWS
ncbi:uncharacterized protein [Ptychodera flava]|uniref:uncharacterized protein n=1 Tax=Ptychodera flava TaxID=63121 RepID=UPI00396A5354